jgi:putative ABC transport system permease protein
MTGQAALALLAYWRRAPLQLATLILGLALATALWSAVQAINSEARASYAEAAAQLGQTSGGTLTANGAAIPLSDYVALRRAGWQVAPVLEGRQHMGARWVQVLGVDPLTYPAFPALNDQDEGPSLQSLMTGDGVVVLRPDLATDIRAETDLELVISDAVPPGVLLMDVSLAERLLNRQGELSRLIVFPNQPRGLPRLADVVPDLLYQDQGAGVETDRLTDSFHLNLTAFGLLSFAVGLFIVHGTAGLAFQQRRGLFRTLRALGVPLSTIGRLLAIELLVLALVAGSLGLALGYVIAAALLPDVAATLRGLYGAYVDGGLSLRPVWFASGLGMAVSGALIAGASGLLKLYRMPILTAPGTQSWEQNAARQRAIMALGGCALLAAAIAVMHFGSGLLAGFALLAGLLLGAALLLPWGLATLLGLGARWAQGVVSEWLWADLRAQLPGLSLAMMALLLALATNVGVGTMVSSFRLTFTGWLDQRLAAELYLSAESDEQAVEIANWLATRTDAILPSKRVDLTLGGRPGQLFGIVDHATYRENWPLLESDSGVWDRVADGSGVIINEQLARHANLWPGTLNLTPERTLTVVGVYSDYGNPLAQAIVSDAAQEAIFGPVGFRQMGVRVAPEAVPDLTDALRRTFDLPVTALIDQAGIKAISLAVFENTFVVTAALNVLTLGVASFAILTALLTLWSIRLPQVAPVWALGLTRRHLAWQELLRSLLLAGLTAILALPLGLALAWVLLSVINVEAFGWRLPMFLFPLDWLRLAVLALLAAALAAVIPARRLMKIPPAQLLSVFAHER